MKIRELVLTSLFIALSFIGANIKVLGTIAFDSMPGFLGTLILGPVYGAVIGALGHFLTALTSGFPLTLPVHLLLMITMALTMLGFGFVYKKFSKINILISMILSVIAGTLLNGPVSLILLMPILGKGTVLALMPVLTGVAALNAILAVAVYKFIPERFQAKEVH